jgi:hypothetical protein
VAKLARAEARSKNSAEQVSIRENDTQCSGILVAELIDGTPNGFLSLISNVIFTAKVTSARRRRLGVT